MLNAPLARPLQQRTSQAAQARWEITSPQLARGRCAFAEESQRAYGRQWSLARIRRQISVARREWTQAQLRARDGLGARCGSFAQRPNSPLAGCHSLRGVRAARGRRVQLRVAPARGER